MPFVRRVFRDTKLVRSTSTRMCVIHADNFAESFVNLIGWILLYTEIVGNRRKIAG